jgi:two-component system OmpR family sensor kinase
MNLGLSHSLRARLLGFLLAAVGLVAAAQALVAYRAALDEADEIFDYQMQQVATALRSGLPIGAVLGPGGLPQGEENIDFVVQVWTTGGLRVFQSARLHTLSPPAVPGFSTMHANGGTYRVFSMHTPSQVIQIAQDFEARRRLAGTLALRTMAPIALMAPLLMLVVWWVVNSSLAPVQRVQRQLAQRHADDLQDVGEAGVPDEVRPLVSELNLLLRRVRHAFEAQRSFVADAAHELRSPLTALKLQVEGLQRASDDASRAQAIARVGTGIDRATRLVDQLLVLARQQARALAGEAPQPVVLAELARLELADAAPAALSRGIDLGLGRADEVAVSGHTEALRTLLRNLLDNAVKYTPAGGAVNLDIVGEPGAVVLRVEDSGPGIAHAERERVLDRFYRLPGTLPGGSGLGLAIVKAIADLHDARLSLGKSERLGGLCAEVSFPRDG